MGSSSAKAPALDPRSSSRHEGILRRLRQQRGKKGKRPSSPSTRRIVASRRVGVWGGGPIRAAKNERVV